MQLRSVGWERPVLTTCRVPAFDGSVLASCSDRAMRLVKWDESWVLGLESFNWVPIRVGEVSDSTGDVVADEAHARKPGNGHPGASPTMSGFGRGLALHR